MEQRILTVARGLIRAVALLLCQSNKVEFEQCTSLYVEQLVTIHCSIKGSSVARQTC